VPARTVYTGAEWLVKPGREEEFVEAWTEFVDWSLEEAAGALGGMLLQDRSEPRRFLSLGPWESREEAEAWLTRADLEERAGPLREVAQRFEPRFLELRIRRGTIA
jgi:heme-degrading monooxygenase HmoA